MQARALRTVEIILSAAARVLVRRGFAKSTTNHIAERAGVSIGTLYEYFPNKEAIVHTLLDRHVDEAERVLGQFDVAALELALRQPLSATLEQLIGFMVQLHERDPALHRVLFEQAIALASVRARVHALEQRYTALLTQLLARHREARVRNPAVAARIVVSSVEHLVHGWVLDDEEKPLSSSAYEHEILRLVVAYLTASER